MSQRFLDLPVTVDQRQCWNDNIKEWTSPPTPDRLTTASCRKHRKMISAESSIMSILMTPSVQGLSEWVSPKRSPDLPVTVNRVPRQRLSLEMPAVSVPHYRWGVGGRLIGKTLNQHWVTEAAVRPPWSWRHGVHCNGGINTSLICFWCGCVVDVWLTLMCCWCLNDTNVLLMS